MANLPTLTPVQFYLIMSVNSQLYLVPSDPSDSGSQLVQESMTNLKYPQTAFQWGFISEGTKQYRIFNAFSGLSIDARGNDNPPKKGEAVQQYQWMPNQGNQEWYLNGDVFQSTYDAHFVWDVDANSKEPGALVQMYSYNGGAKSAVDDYGCPATDD